MWRVFDCARHMVCGVGMYRYSEAEDPWPCANRPKRAAQRLCVCVHVVWWLCSSLWLVKVRELVCVCPRAGIGTWCLRHAWEVHIGGQRRMEGCFGVALCKGVHVCWFECSLVGVGSVLWLYCGQVVCIRLCQAHSVWGGNVPVFRG